MAWLSLWMDLHSYRKYHASNALKLVRCVSKFMETRMKIEKRLQLAIAVCSALTFDLSINSKAAERATHWKSKR